MKTLTNLILVIATFLCINHANAQKMSVQGTLKNAAGVTVADGERQLKFRIYNVPTGGVHLWEETATVNVVGGIYSYLIGSNVALPLPQFANGTTLYLGIVAENFEMQPRTELAFAPYALGVNAAYKVICSGAVGDVKYSILNPTQFAAVNGDCWVPMTGGTMSGSELATILGTNAIPDAGGLFIRAQETPGGPNHDPDRTPTSPIAQFEDQGTQEHKHTFSGQTNDGGIHSHQYTRVSGANDVNDGGSDHHNPNGSHDNNAQTAQGGNHAHQFSGQTDFNDGLRNQETRPKNLNLYIYIRIN
ncbi:MAG: hypothetical protein IPM42_11995 [Saprospiraceae bacterium]|nr:hypothetical protein [Saprospiraceae bacterium]